MKSMKSHPPISPGEILLEEYLIPMGISQNALARAGTAEDGVDDIRPQRLRGELDSCQHSLLHRHFRGFGKTFFSLRFFLTG